MGNLMIRCGGEIGVPFYLLQKHHFFGIPIAQTSGGEVIISKISN